MFALGDPGRVTSPIEGAGLGVERIEEIELVWTFADFDTYWDFVLTLAGGCSIALKALPDEDRSAIRGTTENLLSGLRADDGSYVLPGVTLVALASAG